MKTNLAHYKISEVIEGFEYDEFEGKGLFGLSGKLTIQPEYQRNYIYKDEKKRCTSYRFITHGLSTGFIIF